MNIERNDSVPEPSPTAAGDRREPRRSRWPWLLALAAVGVTIFLLAARGSKDAASADKSGKAGGKSAASARAVPVIAATARKGDVGVYLSGLGTVTSLSTVTVRSRVDGQLVSVGFQEGQHVKEGDLLAQIDPRPFEVQLAQAQGQLAKDEAALKNAQLDLERYKVLIEQDSIPRQQLDTQVATVNQFEGAIETDRAQVDSAKLNLVYSRITSPITGRVGLRLVDPGNMVHASDANGMLVITQLQPIAVLFTIPADQLPQVLGPMRAGKKLEVDAYDRDFKKKLGTGSLIALDNQIDPTTGTVRLKAVFPNEDESLFPNQFVNARLLVDTLHGVVIVPTAAIQRSPQSTFVYAVKSDDTVDLRPVQIQLTEGEDTAIRQGLQAGDVVVVDGVDKLQPGSKVSVAGAGGGAKASGEAAAP